MHSFRHTSFIWLLLVTSSTFAQDKSKKTPPLPLNWKAGAASVAITPKENLWLAGYAGRMKPADGVAQDLFAKALALEDHTGQRLVIVTMDFISVRRTIRNVVADRVLAERKLPPQFLLMNASHTHCGPELSSRPGFEEKTREYQKTLEDSLVKVIVQAIDRLAPARLSYAHGRCGFAMNRRTPSEKGYQNHPNSDGPVDHTVPVLAVHGAENKLLSVAFGYACHATTVFSTTLAPAPPTFLFHGDYPGYAQAALQQAYPETVAMFVNGCGGDQNPYPRNGEFPGKLPLEMAEHHGKTLAGSVVAAMQGGSRPLEGTLRAAMGEIELERNGDNPRLSYLIQALRIGNDLTMVALSSETVVDYSLRLKRDVKAPIVWVAGYSNEMIGYIPSRRVAAEGGYEASKDFKLDVEERIISKVLELTRSLE